MDSAPQARPNLSMRPEGALLTPSKRGASQPPILFSREKRTGRWSGPREKTPGAPRLNALHEARMGPWTPSLLGVGASRELGVGVGGAFYASGGAVSLLAPDDFSLVPPGGTVSGGEAATVLLRRADECRRSTKGARVSGDRSLLNHGAPTAPRAVGNKKEMVGPTVPRLEGGSPRLRPVAAFLVPARGRNRSFQASGTGNPIPQSALRRPAPFTQGGLVRSRLSAEQKAPRGRYFRRTPRFYTNLTEFYSGFTGTKRRS